MPGIAAQDAKDAARLDLRCRRMFRFRGEDSAKARFSLFRLCWKLGRMTSDSKPDPALRRRMRTAERKLREAEKRLMQTERSIRHWSRVLADLRYEKTCATQHPLWPAEELKTADQAGFEPGEPVESSLAGSDR